MDLTELNVFLTVARERSFSRAAQKLYRTQPAVSISVRKLEEWVGEPLFVRGARAGQLTDAGKLLSVYAERILNLREEIKRAMEDLRSGGRGELSLGVNESSIHALLPFLVRYQRLYPDVHLSIQRTLSRDIPSELLSHHLDLGVASFIPQDPQLAAERIFRDELVLVVSPKHRLAKQGSAQLSDLGAEHFVAHSVESSFRVRVLQLFARHRVPLNIGVELPTIESIKRFVQMDLGVAIVPKMCVRWELDQGLLTEVKVHQLRMPRDLYLLHRRGPLSHAAEAMMNLLQARAAAHRRPSRAKSAAAPAREAVEVPS